MFFWIKNSQVFLKNNFIIKKKLYRKRKKEAWIRNECITCPNTLIRIFLVLFRIWAEYTAIYSFHDQKVEKKIIGEQCTCDRMNGQSFFHRHKILMQNHNLLECVKERIF